MIPPPPIFKPTFVQMQKNPSFSISNDSSPILTYSNTNTNGNSNNNPEFSYLPNSNYLTCSFMPNEEYDSNNLVKFSPCISPMSKFHDTELSLNSQNVDLPSQQPPQRKRRRSSSSKAFNKEEIERKKKELKTQHSIIEKKRRIKMNREFEALKFLVPACRLNIINGLNESYRNFENSNSMHKLTILQSTVEYIKYLHFIIRLMKHKVLTSNNTSNTSDDKKSSINGSIKWLLEKQNDLDFANFDLDLQNYRRIENEFNFEDLFMKVWENNGTMVDINDPLCNEINKLIGELGGAVGKEKESATANKNLQESDFSEEDDDESEEDDEEETAQKSGSFDKFQKSATQYPMIKYIPYSQSTLTPPITATTTTNNSMSLSPTSSGSSIQSKSSSSSPRVNSNNSSSIALSTGAIYSRSQSISAGQVLTQHHNRRTNNQRTPKASSNIESLSEVNFRLPLPAMKIGSTSATNIPTSTTTLDFETNSNSNSSTSLTEINATKGLILLKDGNGSRRTSIESLLN